MTTSGSPVSLRGLAVGFSGAVPERKYWTEIAQDRSILEFVAQLAGLAIKYGGRVVHGAHPTFTPILLRQAELHASESPEPVVTVCMSSLWAKNLSGFERDRFQKSSKFVVVPQVGDGESTDPVVRNASLTAMRRVLINEMSVLVAVGGMRHEGTGLIPGVAEEVALAQKRGLACFVIGGLGGEAAQVAEKFKLDPESLKNGLSREKNTELLSNDNISACVGIVFEHLAQNRELLARSLPPLT